MGSSVTETMESRRQWDDTFQVQKGKKKIAAKHEFYIWENGSSKMKEKLKHYQIKES